MKDFVGDTKACFIFGMTVNAPLVVHSPTHNLAQILKKLKKIKNHVHNKLPINVNHELVFHFKSYLNWKVVVIIKMTRHDT